MENQKNVDNQSNTIFIDIQKQKNEWRKKSWSIPDIRGGKQIWYALVKKLVELVDLGQAYDLDSFPDIYEITQPQSWRTYATFLKGVGLVRNQAGRLMLSDVGKKFLAEPTQRNLADQIQDRFRLFGEVLSILEVEPATVEETDKQLCNNYGLHWKNLSNIRRRMDWLEVLGLIQAIGNHKWEVTESGREALKEWCLIKPEILELMEFEPNGIEIDDPPEEIAILLQHLKDSPEMHKKRCTYNIWVPSPNRIENLRMIIQNASDQIAKTDLFGFIANKFNLRLSSVESMLPFLKASGLLEEVGRNIYIATPAAKAWLETGSDLDFIRILHANMQFVGEMIKAAECDTVRNDIYAQAKLYGLNAEKARWIAGFLLEAGLLEETQYLHLKASHIGKCFIADLPLAEANREAPEQKNISDEMKVVVNQFPDKLEEVCNRLHSTSIDPGAEGKGSGVAFEEAIADIFCFMGFKAERIGGSGDTDVVVKWKDEDDKYIIAIIDGKSKSGGRVSHSDISDIAIDTHKEKNNADYVAIVGPEFSDGTICTHARKKGFSLITENQLTEIARASKELGLSLQEIALVFQVPNGLSQLEEIISTKKRELDIISEVVAKFLDEQQLLDGLSPRDLFLLLRNSNESPSLDELINIFETLAREEIGILQKVDGNGSPENVRYMLRGVEKTINRLRALASAIEKGIRE
ncbi:MAG: restriction endonuclease [Lachnospiraceae bacterium]|nr:restriction endonuclease [Lachnospiraceae bacterium]